MKNPRIDKIAYKEKAKDILFIHLFSCQIFFLIDISSIQSGALLDLNKYPQRPSLKGLCHQFRIGLKCDHWIVLVKT
jgi:hypothetical protein